MQSNYDLDKRTGTKDRHTKLRPVDKNLNIWHMTESEGPNRIIISSQASYLIIYTYGLCEIKQNDNSMVRKTKRPHSIQHIIHISGWDHHGVIYIVRDWGSKSISCNCVDRSNRVELAEYNIYTSSSICHLAQSTLSDIWSKDTTRMEGLKHMKVQNTCYVLVIVSICNIILYLSQTSAMVPWTPPAARPMYACIACKTTRPTWPMHDACITLLHESKQGTK